MSSISVGTPYGPIFAFLEEFGRESLSRPGSNSVRVIPPLRGLERVFCCAWCHTQLFNLASVIRTDIRIAPLSDNEEAAVWAAQKHGTEHLDSYTSHNLFPLSVPQAAKEDLHEKESSSYLMPAPSPRGSNISFSNASFPDDSKITSLPMSANNSFNSPNGSRGGVNGYKSPPKTMRSKAAKTFDFEEAEEPVSRGTPRTNLFTVNEATQPKISYDHTVGGGGGIGGGGGQGERATSPMEISDEKSTHMGVIKRTGSSGMKDEKSSLAIEPPPVSSRRGSFHGNFSLQTHTEGFDRHDDQTNHINHSRPGSSSSSSYRSKAPGGISNLSVNHSHPVAINGTESPRITFPHGSRESFAYPSPRNRPQSAEKRRWLARVNLLKSDNDLDEKDDMEDQHAKASSSDHFGQNFRPSPKHDEKVAKLSHDDDQAIKLGFGCEEYIHLEYLEWMGEDLLSPLIDSGELKCGNCHRIIGSWTWTPSARHTLNGILQAPVIRVHKNVIHEVDIPLDPTPANTPRVDDQMEDGRAHT